MPDWTSRISTTTGAFTYKGTWNANTNTPTLSSNGGGGIAGEFYVVSVGGTTNIDSENSWTAGDWIVNGGTLWRKVDNTDLVTSVAARTGAIVIAAADVANFQNTVSANADVAANKLAKHTQGTDQGLDTGGENAVTAAQAKAGYTHSTVEGNPHGVGAADIGVDGYLSTMAPSGVGSANIIGVIPSAALTADAAIWRALFVDGSELDPSGDDIVICPVHIDLSGVVPSGANPDIQAACLVAVKGGTAISIFEGTIEQTASALAAAGAIYNAHRLNLDVSLLNAASEIHGLSVSVAGGTPAGKVAAISARTFVDPVHQHIAPYVTPDQAEFAGRKGAGGTVWADGIDGNEVFVVNDDAIYIGAATQFEELEVILTTPGTKTISPLFYFCTAADTWTQFFPTDATNGFKNSGLISWDLSSISGSWTGNGDPGAGETTAGYWIKIVRSAAPDPGTPTVTTIKTGIATLYSWDSDGLLTINKVRPNQILLKKGVDVASANALTLGADGNYFDITGTTAITSIGTLGVGTTVKLHFDDALTLTHHATDLILPSGANITTAAGDEAEFTEYASGDWRCTSYTKASGYPIVEIETFSICSHVKTESCTVSNSAVFFVVPAKFNGWNITSATSSVGDAKGITDNMTVQVVRVRAGAAVNVLNTPVTLGDVWTATSSDVNTSNDDLATGDIVYIDTTAIHSGTAAKGLGTVVTMQKP